MQKSRGLTYSEIRQAIVDKIPTQVGITRIEFEGPRLAIYCQKPEYLQENSHIIGEIAGTIKKRIVIRSDPSVRMGEDQAESIIREIIEDSGLVQAYFDPTLGEVVLDVEKPGVAIGKNGKNIVEIIKKTHWNPNFKRNPPIPSMTIRQIRGFLYSKSKEREKVLRETGESIFRPKYQNSGDVRITFLGGTRQVGRSAILIKTRESEILMDCGINPGSRNSISSYPRLDVDEFNLSRLDAVVITHAHLDHCGFLPYLYKYGYNGPVYCSEPTSSIMTLLQSDYIDVTRKEGRAPPYSTQDISEVILHTIPLTYGDVTDISPDIRLTLHNAGHILGSSMAHLHIGKGLHNVVYTGDFKYGATALLQPANSYFPRVETLIMESTYGGSDNYSPSRKKTESMFVDVCNRILQKGKVLIPVPAVGRAQEILMVINKYMNQGDLLQVPVYIEGMISEATGIHTAYPGYLNHEVRDKILEEGINPFESDYFTVVKQHDLRDEIVEGGPCIIMATAGMMEGGPVLEYFKRLAPDEDNGIIFVSYQVSGTLGNRIQSGMGSAQIYGNDGKMEIINIKLGTHSVNGFSGHSDRRQLMNYVKRLKPTPRRVFLVHGEKTKCSNLARSISRLRRVRGFSPRLLDTFRLA